MLDAVDGLYVVVGLAPVKVELAGLGAHKGHGVALRVPQRSHSHFEALFALDDSQDTLNALPQQGLIAGSLKDTTASNKRSR